MRLGARGPGQRLRAQALQMASTCEPIYHVNVWRSARLAKTDRPSPRQDRAPEPSTPHTHKLPASDCVRVSPGLALRNLVEEGRRRAFHLTARPCAHPVCVCARALASHLSSESGHQTATLDFHSSTLSNRQPLASSVLSCRHLELVSASTGNKFHDALNVRRPPLGASLWLLCSRRGERARSPDTRPEPRR